MSRRRIAVVGAGLGGLAAAIRLASRGHEVHLFEKHDHAGGKANTLRIGGFRFDTGPSLLTMREVFEELFSFAGSSLEDWLHLRPLDPICEYFFPDGLQLPAWADPKIFAEEVEHGTEDTAETVLEHLGYCKRIYDSAGDLFLTNTLHALSTYLRPKVIGELLRPWRIDPLRTMNRANEQRFTDPRLVQLFNRYATYNGSDPYRAPATLNIIPYVEHCMGAYGVEGGIYRIVDALEGLAKERGVHLHYSEPVERIIVSGRRVSGLRAGGEDHAFDAVISNADIAVTYSLLPEKVGRRRESLARQEASTSAVVFLWGVKRSFSELGLHNVLFSEDYREEFRDIFERRLPPRDPTVYMHISSKLTPQDAPAGSENWFILVNAPPDSGQDWPREVDRLRPLVRDRIGRTLGLDPSNSIVVERVLTPVDIESMTGSEHGSLYGPASNSRMSAFRRHPNRFPGLSGLYVCGGSTHPGGGMPLVLLSARIATDLIARYEL